MTQDEYEDRVAQFFKAEGVNCLSEDSTSSGESYFSWRPCDVCRRPLGGDRVDMSGYNPTTQEVQDGYSVCTDCVLYIANGDIMESY